MPLFYANLDDALRTRMLAEIEFDRAAGRLYLSAWLTPAGQAAFPDLLRQAAAQRDDGWLASRLDIREGGDANLGLREGGWSSPLLKPGAGLSVKLALPATESIIFQ